MPAYEIALPPGAKNIKIKTSTQEIAVDPTYYRSSKDGDIPIVALFGGDEFVGEVLEGQWLKGDDGHIQGPFSAKINNGYLELTGKSDVSGTWRAGWVSSTTKVPLLDDLIVDIHLSLEGLTDSDENRFHVFLSDSGNGSNPSKGQNFLRLILRATTTTYYIQVEKKVNGTITYPLLWTEVTNKEGTFRIKFEENKPGHNHTHIYYHDGAGSVDESTDEIPGSPFQLNLGIDQAYVGYFFESTETTNRTVSSDFVRITYPDFSVRYDLDDSDYQSGNRGEVVVWDTMNSDDEDDWVRVFDPSHKFVGDCIVENGLVRLLVDDSASQGLKIYYWDGQWTLAMKGFQRPTDSDRYVYFKRLVKVTPEECKVLVRMSTSPESLNEYADFYLTLRRGKYDVIVEGVESSDKDFVTFDPENIRFSYIQDEKVVDADLTSIHIQNTNPSDNFLMGFHPSSPVITGFASTKLGTAFRMLNSEFYNVYGITFTQLKTMPFLLPFSKVANLFKEAEDATLSGADTHDPDVGESGLVARLDAYDEYVAYQFTGISDLPKGRYIAFVRHYADGGDQTFTLRVYDTTDSKHLNEENEDVTVTAQNGTWNYTGIVFDITDDEDGHNIQIRARQHNNPPDYPVYVDYFLIIPIGNGESWPQDIAHNALRTLTKTRKIYPR